MVWSLAAALAALSGYGLHQAVPPRPQLDPFAFLRVTCGVALALFAMQYLAARTAFRDGARPLRAAALTALVGALTNALRQAISSQPA
ncbi:hypothetical protein ACH4PU_06380 [Streptomyces sp. NPDC021100]|uniref:hypothetical protein n=1 Tax=Streptomyces sp. NPDC021100 TaxID=3365114 RepID=UPI003796464B